MTRGTVVIVALLVSSAIMPFVALGQTDDNVYSHTFSDVSHLNVNQADISGDFTVTVSTTEVPGRSGEKVLLARERLGSGAEKWIRFNNEGVAYDNVTITVKVHGSGQPEFANGREMGLDLVYFIGGTGGDADMRCDTGERMSTMTNPFVDVVDCTPKVENTVDTSDLDAQQTKIEIYQSAQNQHASEEQLHTTRDNYLNDTRTQALIAGKNAYIRALNNGSSKSAAKTAAKGAVQDYYHTKQVNLVTQWDAALAHHDYLQNVSRNQSLEARYASQTFRVTDHSGLFSDSNDHISVESYNYSTKTLTTVDNKNIDSTVLRLDAYNGYDTGNHHYYNIDLKEAGTKQDNEGGDGVPITVKGLGIKKPNSDYSDIESMDINKYRLQWTQIEAQNSDVQSQIDVLVNGTYDEYQAGDINNSDLVDPYVFTQEFSPGEDYQVWAASQLTMLGANGPETMDSVGEFNISAESGNYSGILMSQTNPASGQFETNTTYNPNAINGTQYVVTDSSVYELTTNFSISSIETTDGETRQNVTIRNVTYETADVNTTELRLMYEDLAYQQAQLEARKAALRDDGGGGGGLLGSGSIDKTVALLALAALAGAALLNS